MTDLYKWRTGKKIGLLVSENYLLSKKADIFHLTGSTAIENYSCTQLSDIQLLKDSIKANPEDIWLKQELTKIEEGEKYSKKELAALKTEIEKAHKISKEKSDKELTTIFKKVFRPKTEEKGLNNKIKLNEKFFKPDLILEIHATLSETHLADDKEKVACFIGACTGLLSPPNLHKSIALLGNSSAGKDNLMHTTLSHLPREKWIFLTSATKATMEDDISRNSVIAYSEFNTGKENGANIELEETIKQLAEGGISAYKKDASKGFTKLLHSQQEQKSVIFSTTETEKDEELETRFVCISVSAEPGKIQAVNNNTFDIFAGLKKEQPVSWIAEGISQFEHSQVIIPFATLFKEKIAGAYLFDNTDARSMRDVKRFLCFVSAFAWLHQLQREKNLEGYIIAKPFDFMLAVVFCADFFNQTYKGVDARLQKVIDTMDTWFNENSGANDMSRLILEEKLKVSRSTVKRYLKVLSNKGLVAFSKKEGNEIYYQRCPKGVQKPFIGVQFEELVKFFTLDTLTPISDDKQGVQNSRMLCKLSEEELKVLEKCRFTASSQILDTLKWTPSQKIENPNPKIETEDVV